MQKAFITQTRKGKRELAKFLYERIGATGEMIADTIGVSRQIISRWVKRYKWKSNRQTINKEGILIATAYKKAGFSNAAIAKKMGVSKQIVGRWLNHFILTPKGIKKLSAKEKRARNLLIVQGYSQKATAKEIGVSEMTIYRWKIKYNWQGKNESWE
jgi:transposase